MWSVKIDIGKMIFKNLIIQGSLMLFFFIYGCEGEEFSFPKPTSGKADGAFISEYREILVGDSKYMADFGTITVKENRGEDNSRFIHLPVIRIHAGSGKGNIPVFYFNGGPGMSNIAGLENMWYLMPEHDVVIVGFRGVDGSSILNCPEVKEAMKGEGDLFSPNSMKKIAAAWQASAQRLSDEGVDINGYTILDVIQDNELVKTALGYEKINLAGGSYGTRVAYYYGLLHPDVINRSVLKAVNPPGHFVWDAKIINNQLLYFSKLWSKDKQLSKTCPDLYATILNVQKNMPKNWLVFPINKGKVSAVAFSLLFQEATSAMVFDAYIAAENGDASGLALMSIAYDLVMPGMITWGDLASKAVSVDYDSTINYREASTLSEFPFGAPMSMLLWGPLEYGTWPIKQIPSKFDSVQYSDVETLLLSGSVDVGTPTEFATGELLPYLNKGKQIILKECGHMDYDSKHGKNVRRIITSFFSTGVPDTSLNRYIPMNFEVGWGFPKIAKIGLAVFIFLLLIVIVLIYWTTKIIRKRYQQKLLTQV